MSAAKVLKLKPTRHPQDTYEYANGKSLRLLGKKILVQGHPLPKETSGGIIMPGRAVEHVWRVGTILAFGYMDTPGKRSKRIPIPDIEAGLHCCFVRYLAEQDSNKQLRLLGENDIFAIGPTDILFVWPANMKNPPDINL